MTTIEINASALRDLVTPVMPLAARGGFIPVLESIHIESTDGFLIASATDRFRAGICRQRADVKPGIDILVHAVDLKQILSIFKPTKHVDPVLTLQIKNEGNIPVLYVEQSGGLDFLSASFRYAIQSGDFPNVKLLIEGAGKTAAKAEAFGVNLSLLADFKHAVRTGGPAAVQSAGPTKPVIVTVGDHFVGLIMPVRLNGEVAPVTAETPGQWADYLNFPGATAKRVAS